MHFAVFCERKMLNDLTTLVALAIQPKETSCKRLSQLIMLSVVVAVVVVVLFLQFL